MKKAIILYLMLSGCVWSEKPVIVEKVIFPPIIHPELPNQPNIQKPHINAIDKNGLVILSLEDFKILLNNYVEQTGYSLGLEAVIAYYKQIIDEFDKQYNESDKKDKK